MDYLIAGPLRQEYILTQDGKAHLGILGGAGAYAASGARIWSSSVGIVSRVGADFPAAWLSILERGGIQTSAIKTLPEPHNTLAFYSSFPNGEYTDSNPSAHFLEQGLPLPKDLVDFGQSPQDFSPQRDFGPLTIRPDDVLPGSAPGRGAHLTPSELITHTTLPVRLRDMGIRLITLQASSAYMEPGFENELPIVISGLDTFLVQIEDARAFFRPREPELWEMAEAFAAMGCRTVILKRGARGQAVFDKERGKRWIVPAYPGRTIEPTGVEDAYCGGFLVGMGETSDVLHAALQGTVSASIAASGVGAAYMLDAMPGLAQARLDSLRSAVKEV